MFYILRILIMQIHTGNLKLAHCLNFDTGL